MLGVQLLIQNFLQVVVLPIKHCTDCHVDCVLFLTERSCQHLGAVQNQI